MAWIETTSLTFTARHEDADRTYAEELIDRLEDLSLKLEDRFERVPGGITLVVHPSPAWLSVAQPFLPFVRWSAAPAGRRYLAGWALSTEVHVLGEKATTRRAAGEASLEALRGTADRLYTQIVLAANNEALPPPWSPSRSLRYLDWAWLVQGGAQHFSRQVDHFRTAVIRRLREGSRPAFPPSRRDAIILGGTIFELLEEQRGGDACESLVLRLRRAGPEASLEHAFALPSREIEDLWRDYLRTLTRPRSDLRPAGPEDPFDDDRGL